jgi:uncharacterized protein YkuJ
VTHEQPKFGEQALNKIAELALASQLEEVERLEVQIKTDLNKLAHGEIDSIAINLYGLVMQQNLAVEELQLQINQVTVKPLSAIFGKIKLTHPSRGTVRIVINEDNLTCAFKSESFYKHLHQMQSFAEDKRIAIHVQQVKCCLLADGNIAFKSELILGETGEFQSVTFTTTPRIGFDRQGVVLEDIHYPEDKELPPELIAVLTAQMNEVLSLRKFEQKGMSLQIQQLDIVAGKLTLQAAAYIEQFPSS